MGMPITVEVVDTQVAEEELEKIFQYFNNVDEKFSTYKPTSEISKINRGELKPENYSPEMRTVLNLCEEWKHKTQGFFDAKNPDGHIDPSGLVKGWAIFNAAELLATKGFKNFYVEAGGDIEARGLNANNQPWSVGIKNPFVQEEIIKVLQISNQGLATSGTYIRGQHIYNPKMPNQEITDIVSLTVIGPNVYQADCFATAAFAMGKAGIGFIEQQKNLEGYVIDKFGVATMTTYLEKYV